MKGFNLSCASSAATAISTAMDQRSPSIHHHHSRGNPFSNLPQLSPLKPKRHQTKNRKSSASDRPIDPISPPGSTRYLLDDEATLDGSSDVPEFLMRSQSMKSLASSSHDTSSISSTTSGGPRCRPPLVIDPMRFRSVEPGESPVLSVSRYKASLTIDRTRFRSVEGVEESPVLKTPVVSASTSSSDKQVCLSFFCFALMHYLC
ncbi:hypothetical protein QJS04_geneDACA019979 [Acorus gramineus]|uniref:Uncharacterized protein n=1 Tax=Acorus gramineus TaxID=55184 RepID=A0AAV9B4B9_ACOGR|nr:hypothetical protein QJS04_geneDACA019979 [Acorus gramineus]